MKGGGRRVREDPPPSPVGYLGKDADLEASGAVWRVGGNLLPQEEGRSENVTI